VALVPGASRLGVQIGAEALKARLRGIPQVWQTENILDAF
jgi:hypothetical protein